MFDYNFSHKNLDNAVYIASLQQDCTYYAQNNYATAVQFAILANTKNHLLVATHDPGRVFSENVPAAKPIISLLVNKGDITVLTDNKKSLENKRDDFEVLSRYASSPFHDYNIKVGFVEQLPIVRGNPAEMIISDHTSMIVQLDSKPIYMFNHNNKFKTGQCTQIFENAMQHAVWADMVTDHQSRNEMKAQYQEILNNTPVNRVKRFLRELVA